MSQRNLSTRESNRLISDGSVLIVLDSRDIAFSFTLSKLFCPPNIIISLKKISSTVAFVETRRFGY